MSNMCITEEMCELSNVFFIDTGKIGYDGCDLDFGSAIEREDEIEVSCGHHVLHISQYIEPKCYKTEDEITYIRKTDDGSLTVTFLIA